MTHTADLFEPCLCGITHWQAVACPSTESLSDL